MSLENLSQTMVETRSPENDDIPEIDTTSFDSRLEVNETDMPDLPESGGDQHDIVYDPDSRIDAVDSLTSDIVDSPSFDPDERIDFSQLEANTSEKMDSVDTPEVSDNVDVSQSDFALENGDDISSINENPNKESESSVDEVVVRKNNEKELYSNDVDDESNEFNKPNEEANVDIVKPQDVKQTRQDYINDLEKLAKYPETIDKERINSFEVTEVSKEQMEIKHAEFDDIKGDLKNQWEKIHGIPWPKYESDVYSHKGNLLRRAGDDYDAHHIHPLSKGGENTVENITPMHVNNHYDKQGIHASGSSCSKLS